MRFPFLVVFLHAAVLVAGCGSDKASTQSKPAPVVPTAAPPAPPVAQGSASATPTKVASPEAAATKVAEPATQSEPPVAEGGHSFTAEGSALLTVGACGGGAVPEGIPAEVVEKHCSVITSARDAYEAKWVKPASAFFADHVPKDAPKKVVYPFAGGDLSTALTVYPDADEITTLSLEPAGDPRTLASLHGKELEAALAKVQYELKFLYRVNFSNTLNMIEAMRGGALPTQLIFGLSAVKLHGYEFVGLRYFRIEKDGAIHYLDDDEVTHAPAVTTSAEQRNFLFSNAEVQFRRPGGRIQVWRHIRANLGNDKSKGIGPGLDDDPRVVKHLEAKGEIAAMTKAASYLLSWDSFSVMREYLIKHVVWMVSDATGVAPRWGKPAGFVYETYGTFEEPHIPAGHSIAKNWRDEFNAEPKRDLNFRFGYYDKKIHNHLIIMKRKAA